MTNVELFEALVGLRFWSRSVLYQFEAGLYGNGRGAIMLMADGEPFMKLTTNMEQVELADDEFLVPWEANCGVSSSNVAMPLWRRIVALGLFEDTGERFDSGYVVAYAAKWKFQRCFGRNDTHQAHGYCVQCPGCLKPIQDSFKKGETEWRARDAARRMGAFDDW